jgi:hypothetical protein
MSKRISTLPEWFDLENYSSLSEMSDEDVLNQVKYRKNIQDFINNANSHYQHSTESIDLMKLKVYCRIIETKPVPYKQTFSGLLGDVEEDEERDEAIEKFKRFTTYEDSPAYLTPVINMIDVDDELLNLQHELNLSGEEEVHFFNSSVDLIMKDYSDRKDKEYEEQHPDEFIDDEGNYIDEPRKHNEISLKVNISEFSDEEILTHLAKMLPLWRHKLGVENIPVKAFRNTDINRIIDYKVIPLMDLFNWEDIYDKKINRRVLFDCIYPDQERGTSFL